MDAYRGDWELLAGTLSGRLDASGVPCLDASPLADVCDDYQGAAHAYEHLGREAGLRAPHSAPRTKVKDIDCVGDAFLAAAGRDDGSEASSKREL